MTSLHLIYNATYDYAALTLPAVVSLFVVFFLSAWISFTLTYVFKITKPIFTTKILEFFTGEEAWSVAIWGSFFFGAFLFILSPTIIQFVQLRDACSKNQLQFVEGRVTDYEPMPYEGHKNEYFTVKGVEFKFTDYSSGIGYHNAASHGGVIKPDLHVRICYYDDGYRNIILRLETERP